MEVGKTTHIRNELAQNKKKPKYKMFTSGFVPYILQILCWKYHYGTLFKNVVFGLLNLICTIQTYIKEVGNLKSHEAIVFISSKKKVDPTACFDVGIAAKW